MSLLIKNWSKANWEELLKWAKIGANNAMIGEFTEVEAIPAADVRPVVHGKWERKRDKCGSFVSCSVCHTSGWYQFAFCPYCGADMRKKGGEKDV